MRYGFGCPLHAFFSTKLDITVPSKWYGFVGKKCNAALSIFVPLSILAGVTNDWEFADIFTTAAWGSVLAGRLVSGLSGNFQKTFYMQFTKDNLPSGWVGHGPY